MPRLNRSQRGRTRKHPQRRKQLPPLPPSPELAAFVFDEQAALVGTADTLQDMAADIVGLTNCGALETAAAVASMFREMVGLPQY